MNYTTSISKTELGLDTNGGATNIKLKPRDRKAAITLATRRAINSFPGADLCEIRVIEFHEWGAHDLSAARITLDIGGAGFGNVNEVLA